jgi:hypothetical protein
MMKANELRIGNWVRHSAQWSYRGDGEREFDLQWQESDWYALGESTLHWANISAIPLTEDWLINLGFVLDILHEGDSPIYYLNDNDNVFQIDSDTLQPLDAGFPIAKYDIKYVHELQNIFFALCGEELIVNT